MYNILQKYFSSFIFLIKVLIISGAYYVISDKLINENFMNSFLWSERMGHLGTKGVLILTALFLCTIVNWSLEIFKWQSLVKSVRFISFYKAAKQSLASLTASLITPNRIGEYGAKAVYYRKKERPKILLLNFQSNAYQMLITILFGLLSIWVLYDYLVLSDLPFGKITGILLAAIFMVSIAMYFKKHWIKRFQNILHDFLKIPQNIHKKAFLFSFARYMVFSHQFYLFLLFFGIDLDYMIAYPTICAMYFISSVIPGFVLFDWLVKGSVAVTLFGYFGVNEIIVLSITASMWMLNFALPALWGSVYVLIFNSDDLVLSESKVSG